MKLPPGLARVDAQVVAADNGKSLAMVNGRPVQIDGDHATGKTLHGFKDGFEDKGALKSDSTPTEKMLLAAGLPPESKEVVTALREYGFSADRQSLVYAASILKKLPGFAFTSENVKALALMIARRLNASDFSNIKNYLQGKFKFDKLFAGIDKQEGLKLKNSWSQSKTIEALFELVNKADNSDVFEKNRLLARQFAENFNVQEMLSIGSSDNFENRIYFSWPVFWSDAEFPDTLEGEAFVPDSDESENGFSLRLLIEPPFLGKMEVALNKLKDSIWVHFGVEKEVEKYVKRIFQPVRQSMFSMGYKNIRITFGSVRLHDSFFLVKNKPEKFESEKNIDLKV